MRHLISLGKGSKDLISCDFSNGGFFISVIFHIFVQMLRDDTQSKIKNITSGTVLKGQPDTCTAIRNFLCTSFATSTTVKDDFEGKAIIKEKQACYLKSFISQHNLWVANLPAEDRFLTRGGEASVYLDEDNKNVIKLNDAVYYATWLEFFNSVLLHNLIFENTSYSLIGFFKENNSLNAVLKQQLFNLTVKWSWRIQKPFWSIMALLIPEGTIINITALG